MFSLLTPTVSGEKAAELGYVNAGTDKRIGGELGRLLGRTQSQLSFKDSRPPNRQVDRVGNILVEIATAPNGRPHIAIAIPRGDGQWVTIRAGWRHDRNWGDANVIGHNPEPAVIGGYIADFVFKGRARQTFISGYEQG
jgi:hypothetical protein